MISIHSFEINPNVFYFNFSGLNSNMLSNHFTKKNFKNLTQAGYKIYDSDSGSLACGDIGKGRMEEPRYNRIKTFLKKKIFFKEYML